MKKWLCTGFAITLLFSNVSLAAEDGLKIGTVSYKTCVETSKLGKQEKVRFDQVKRQFEQELEKKEKELNEMAPKFTDEYLDTLTPEAEAQLKEQFRKLSEEVSVQRNQFYQSLNETNSEIMEKLIAAIQEASKAVATSKKLDLILNDEICTFKSESLNVTSDVIKELDDSFEKAAK